MHLDAWVLGMFCLVPTTLLGGCGNEPIKDEPTNLAQGVRWIVEPPKIQEPSLERKPGQIMAEAAALRETAISEYHANPSDLTKLRLAASYFQDLGGHFKESQETNFRISPRGISVEAPIERPRAAADGSSWSRPGKEKRLMAKLPLRACEPFALSSRGHNLEVRRLNVGCESAQVGLFKGAVVYGHTFVTASSERVEEFAVIDNPNGQLVYEYVVNPSSEIKAIRDAQDYLEFLDASDVPMMRFHYAVAQGAQHGRRKAELKLEGVKQRQGFQHGGFSVYEIRAESVRVSMKLSLSGLKGPVVVDPGWSSTTSLATARANHSAQLLPSGKVLVTGGWSDALGWIFSSEVFDPTTGSWSASGSLNARRGEHTSTLLPTGEVLVVGGFGDANHLVSCELYHSETGTWSMTGSLATGRYNHTATLLASGDVLVTGGIGSGVPHLSTCEIYDPENGTWADTGALATGRDSHTATLLPSGNVLVASGYSSGSSPTTELYDPVQGTWSSAGLLSTNRNWHTATLLPTGNVLVSGGIGLSVPSDLYDVANGTWSLTGALGNYRLYHSASLLPSGKVLVAGGWGDPSSAELYDAGEGTWSSTASLSQARYSHTATLLPSGRVLVVGGWNGSNHLTSCELFDPGAGSWSATGSLAQARAYHTTTLLPTEQVLVAGGYNASDHELSSSELYDPASGNWFFTGSLNFPRMHHTATPLPSGRVLVSGGNGTAVSELYYPADGTWSVTGSLIGVRYAHTATLLGSGKVLVAGGENGAGYLSSCELYDPSSGTWSATGSLAISRVNHTATLLPSGKVLVVGGYNDLDTQLFYCELFDPVTKTWTGAGSLAIVREQHTATLLLSGKVLVAGGYNHFTGELTSCELYDPISGIWSATGSLATGRVYHTATLLPSGKVLVAGGYSSSYLASSELYDPATGTWSITSSLGTARDDHTVTLLPSGKVLAVGGYGVTGALLSAEIYDDNGAQDAWRPIITNFPGTMLPETSHVLDGLNFRGVSEGSSGSTNNSATDFPLVLLVRAASGNYSSMAESGRNYILPTRDFSATSATFTTPASSDLPGGYYLLFVMTNAIESEAKIVRVLAEDGTSCLNEVECISGFCASGVCCNRACDGECDQACNLPGDVGKCVVLPETTTCDDSLFCNGVDTCDSSGSCIHAGNPCMGLPACKQTCDEQNDRCQDPDGSPCSDGVDCTDDQCQSGACQNTPNDQNCDDSIPCTSDTCDVGLGCQHTPNNSVCDDNIACTGDSCDPALGCVHQANDNQCNDSIACTLDACDVVLGCVFTPDNGLCPDDGFYCNGAESCDAQQGCVHGVSPCAASGLACDENTDQCVHCLQPQDCDDNVACTTDTCNSSTGNCVFTPDNGLCPDDGLYCNGSESCSAQQGCVHSGDLCVGRGLKCSESLDQCVHCLVTQDCDDGLYCNGAETCGSDGNCVVGTNPCDDSDACTIDSCNEGTDACGHQPDPQCSGGKPLIACQPNLKATVGLGYLYDQDGRIEASGTQPITWAKLQGPEAFHIDPTTGTITWIPATSGQMQIQIQASNDQGNDTCTFDVQVAPDASGIPQALMAINPEMGRVPLSVHLDGSSSVAPAGGSIVSYRWDFGDGSGWGYGPIQDHLFSTAGSYQVGLLVTEAGGSSGQVRGLVQVLSQDGKKPPVARIVASKTQGEGSLTVDFSCACEVGDAPIVGYLWDFADQSKSDQTEVSHTFGLGRYEVKLTVLDENGITGTDRQEIVVAPAGSKKLPPACQASGAPLSGVVPLSVSYIGFYADADGQVTQWKWYFGEEEVTGQANLNRTYSEPGIFDARFVVTDNDGLTCQSSVEVVVAQTPGKTPPKILSLPNKTAACNEPYQYDQDNKPSTRGDRPITWKLGKEINGQVLGKPEGMEINAQTGEITWTPSVKQAGNNKVTLIVSNDQGADLQEFEVEVTCGEKPGEGCGCEGEKERSEWTMIMFAMLIFLVRRYFLSYPGGG